MRLSIRQATARDLDEVAGILHEAAHWLEESGMAMWRERRVIANPHLPRMSVRACSSSPSATAKQQGRFASSSKTNFSGLMFRRTTQRSFTGSRLKDALPAERFLRP